MMLTSKDTIPPSCLLKSSSGEIFNGVYESDAKNVLPSSLGPLHLFMYSISKDDFYKINKTKITDVKFFNKYNEGGIFDIDKGSQDKIAKQSQILTSKLNK